MGNDEQNKKPLLNNENSKKQSCWENTPTTWKVGIALFVVGAGLITTALVNTFSEDCNIYYENGLDYDKNTGETVPKISLLDLGYLNANNSATIHVNPSSDIDVKGARCVNTTGETKAGPNNGDKVNFVVRTQTLFGGDTVYVHNITAITNSFGN